MATANGEKQNPSTYIAPPVIVTDAGYYCEAGGEGAVFARAGDTIVGHWGKLRGRERPAISADLSAESRDGLCGRLYWPLIAIFCPIGG